MPPETRNPYPINVMRTSGNYESACFGGQNVVQYHQKANGLNTFTKAVIVAFCDDEKQAKTVAKSLNTSLANLAKKHQKATA